MDYVLKMDKEISKENEFTYTYRNNDGKIYDFVVMFEAKLTPPPKYDFKKLCPLKEE